MRKAAGAPCVEAPITPRTGKKCNFCHDFTRLLPYRQRYKDTVFSALVSGRDMDDEWYTSGPEGQKGPIPLQKLRETLATHPQAEHLFIWHDSLSDWVRAGDVPGVFTIHDADIPRRPRAPERRPAARGLF